MWWSPQRRAVLPPTPVAPRASRPKWATASAIAIVSVSARWADATGTPEPDGLEPDWVSALIRRLGAEVGLLGGDVMEVAPSLTRTPESARRTVGLAARYFRETVAAALG